MEWMKESERKEGIKIETKFATIKKYSRKKLFTEGNEKEAKIKVKNLCRYFFFIITMKSRMKYSMEYSRCNLCICYGHLHKSAMIPSESHNCFPKMFWTSSEVGKPQASWCAHNNTRIIETLLTIKPEVNVGHLIILIFFYGALFSMLLCIQWLTGKNRRKRFTVRCIIGNWAKRIAWLYETSTHNSHGSNSFLLILLEYRGGHLHLSVNHSLIR